MSSLKKLKANRRDARKNGQIAGSEIVRAGRNAGSTAQPAWGFRGTPPSAIDYAVPEFIWGMSDKATLIWGVCGGLRGAKQT